TDFDAAFLHQPEPFRAFAGLEDETSRRQLHGFEGGFDPRTVGGPEAGEGGRTGFGAVWHVVTRKEGSPLPRDVPGSGNRQWAAAPSAPSPVCERTYCGPKAAFSFSASCERSSTENSQVATKASGTENSAGLL